MSPDDRDHDEDSTGPDAVSGGNGQAVGESAADDREWRFELEDLEDDAEGAAESESEGLVGAADESVEPGSPTLEGTAFVLLGAVFAALALAGMIGLL